MSSTQLVESAAAPPAAVLPSGTQVDDVKESQLRAIFARADGNGDGRLTRAELIKRLRKDDELATLLNLPRRVGDEQRVKISQELQVSCRASFTKLMRRSSYAPFACCLTISITSLRMICSVLPWTWQPHSDWRGVLATSDFLQA